MGKLVQRHQSCNSELTQKYSIGQNTAKPCVTVIMFEKISTKLHLPLHKTFV